MERFLSWICFGVVKGGTTSLYRVLSQHPELFIPKTKETHFFCSPEYERGIDFYRNKYFSDVQTGQRAGDMSPKYFIHKDAPGRIKSAFGPDLKLMTMLRNPVERAWSHYCHSYERFRHFSFRPTEDLSFGDALAAEPARLAEPDEYSFTHHMWNAYKLTGFYFQHLSRWLEYFDPDQIQIILFEDLTLNPTETINQITDHLSVSRFKEVPVLEKTNSYSKPDADPDVLQFLKTDYRRDIEKLEEFLNRDLSHWLG